MPEKVKRMIFLIDIFKFFDENKRYIDEEFNMIRLMKINDKYCQRKISFLILFKKKLFM